MRVRLSQRIGINLLISLWGMGGLEETEPANSRIEDEC
jgi:hypothetical protein